MGGWLALVPRKVQIVVLGAILAAGALFWAHHAGYESGRIDEHLSNDRAKTKAALEARAKTGVGVQTSIAAAVLPTRTAAALHDSVRITDTVTVTITVPALDGAVSMKQNVAIPAIVVRRIVNDSLLLIAKDRIIASQAAELKADTAAINALGDENKTLSDMKTPRCGLKCQVGVSVVKVVVVGEAVVRVVRWLKPRR